ncbi:MAG TPA: DUF5674 family protein [Candidatus Omnitrophota bacterium]|nr:DUF5674 family protein [Candidatus Omnitrophota bacterium]HQJ15210.1 DUF5674 family protein [Candidatus Omnitrophota bacterium]
MMDIIRSRISRQELIARYLTHFETASKAVIDVKRGILALDAELHSDLEAALLKDGSVQDDLWGINLYPHKERKDFIEYTSLINIRPHQGNKSMVVSDPAVRDRISSVIDTLIDYGA